LVPLLNTAQQLRQFGLGFVRTHFDVHSISPSIGLDQFIDQLQDVKSLHHPQGRARQAAHFGTTNGESADSR
jgi:hypothetical protein